MLNFSASAVDFTELRAVAYWTVSVALRTFTYLFGTDTDICPLQGFWACVCAWLCV